MGLTVEEALQLPALAGTSVAAGAANSAAWSGTWSSTTRWPSPVPAPTSRSSSSERGFLRPTPPTAVPWSSGWTRWAPRRRLSSARRARPGARRDPRRGRSAGSADPGPPAGVRLDEVLTIEVLGTVVNKQSQALALSSHCMDDEFIGVALQGGGLAKVAHRLAVAAEGVAVLGLGPAATSPPPAHRGGRGDQRLAVAPRRSGRRRARRADLRRVSGVRADQTVVTPAGVLADADLSPADGILLVPGHHELLGGMGEYARRADHGR